MMIRLLYIIITVALTVPVSKADRQRTMSPKILHPAAVAANNGTTTNTLFDTIPASDDIIRFYGYEKVLRSTRETFFATNQSANIDIEGIKFTISYFDSSGRLLHKRPMSIFINIPAGETRRIDIPSWDRQNTFYYKDSPRPRVKATPYDITITPDSILIEKQ